jgi:hypothetical protein
VVGANRGAKQLNLDRATKIHPAFAIWCSTHRSIRPEYALEFFDDLYPHFKRFEPNTRPDCGENVF